MKVTMRNICDVKRYGTARAIVDMILVIVSRLETDTPVHLDPDSVRLAIEREESRLPDEDSDPADIMDKGTDNNDDMTQAQQVPPETKTESSPETGPQGAKPAGPLLPSSDNGVSARILYIVPPKTSKRRGDKPGCAYIVFTAPLPPAEQLQAENVDKAGKSSSRGGISTAQRARIAARGRLQLQKALASFSLHLLEDAKSRQEYSGATMEASINGKAWKVKQARDRRQGTIETTADFKRFLQQKTQAQEERLARPKPTPGGGQVSTTPSEANEGEQQLSTIVLHLRAKRAEQNKKKKAAKKRSAKSEANKESGSAATGTKEGQTNSKRTKNRRAKQRKKKQPAASKPAASKPTASK